MNRWLFVASSMAWGAAMAAAQTQLQAEYYKVVSTGATAGQAASIQKNAGLRVSPYQQDGVLRFYDPDKLHAIPNKVIGKGTDENGFPTVDTQFDFAAAAKVTPFDSRKAQSILIGLLRSAELLPAVQDALVSNTKFKLVDAKTGRLALSGALDTTVSLQTYLSNGIGAALPVVGPGAKITARFASDGSLESFHCATRGVSPAGLINIVGPDEAEKIFRTQYHLPSTVKLTSKLVYFAPPLTGHRVGFLFPHYQFDAVQTVGRESVALRSMLLPAVKTGPEVNISTKLTGGTVYATPRIVGGTAPYKYFWSSSSSPIAQPGRSTVSYTLSPRLKGSADTLSLRVEDANGLVTLSSTNVLTTLVTTASLEPLPGGVQMGDLWASTDPNPLLTSSSSAGCEWIGMSAHLAGCNDLADSGPNAAGFVTGMAINGVNIRFNWGETNAWETDFRSHGLPGGQDSSYVDGVDCVFYTGHANGDGWVMTSHQANQFVSYSESRLGDVNLEWLVIAACGPLEDSAAYPAIPRWRNSFQGLHFLFGYSSGSYDNTIEGSGLTFWCMGLPFPGFPVATMRESWILSATEAQPAGVTWSFMQPVRNDGVCNWNDHFWGKGTTGPDIPQSTTAYYCLVSGGC